MMGKELTIDMDQNFVIHQKGDGVKNLYERLLILKYRILKAGDEKTAKKIGDLIQKLQGNEMVIAFCGHYSAGKSSMINKIMGHELLPSSPIPTSANLVKIKTGKPYARIYFKNHGVTEFPYPYNIEQIKGFCIDGDRVEAVEISHPIDHFQAGVTILDTPGIDSTDSAHRISTESSLHLADIVLYVMDYNHVQSELNFNFTKMLKDRGLSVFLVINQIDKHSDQELSYESYCEGVNEAFSNWNVHPDGIFYTSLVDLNNPRNQLKELKRLIDDKIASKENILTHSILAAAKHLITEHIQWLQDQIAENRTALESQMGNISIDEARYYVQRYEELNDQLNQLQTDIEVCERDFHQDLNKLLSNANLTPYQTRALAQEFLESCQPGFRVGLLFSAKKTEQEKQDRFQRFYQDLNEKASSQLDWHSRDLLVKYVKKFDINNDTFLQSIYSMPLTFRKELLSEAVKKGATLNGDYVLNYTREISESIKQEYKRQIIAKFAEAYSLLKGQVADRRSQLEGELASITKNKEAYEQLVSLLKSIDNKRIELVKVLECTPDPLELNEAIRAHSDTKQEIIQANTIENILEKRVESLPKNENKEEFIQETKDQSLDGAESNDGMNLLSSRLRLASSIIQGITGFQTWSTELLEKADRLDNRLFTVALFGAFSAGKSSFANALIGERVLPVSPNPTTAAITKVLPVCDEYPHKTVRIKIKEESDLLADVLHSLRVLQFEARSWEDAFEFIANIDHQSIHPKAKPHISFLKAVEKGFSDLKPQLGEVILTGMDLFETFVANEEKAAFVDWIEVYYQSPLTSRGIILVDTPGADSIHARHTGVAFEYIKNADAILFVTYYNHAFSHADREFLVQLGRVKDAFELDKMFFIVNAIDLARTSEEVQLVVQHVRENLNKCGIRLPRIYPVSSQMGLKAKQAEAGTSPDEIRQDIKELRFKSGIGRFEEDFIRFTFGELLDVSTKSAEMDLVRISQKLKEYLENANLAVEERNRILERLRKEKERSIHVLEDTDPLTLERKIEKEINELIYYIKQRLFLRFRDQFKISFSPAALRSDWKDQKQLLKENLEELIQYIRFDLSQELRATTIRIEKYLRISITELFQQIQVQLLGIDETCSLIPYAPPQMDTPDAEKGLDALRSDTCTSVLGMYKNNKQFFEQGGNMKMCEELESKLQQPVTIILSNYAEQYKQYYIQAFQQQVRYLVEHCKKQILEHYDGKESALTLGEDVGTIDHAYLQLKQMITAGNL